MSNPRRNEPFVGRTDRAAQASSDSDLTPRTDRRDGVDTRAEPAVPAGDGFAAYLDRILPGPGSRVDQVSQRLQVVIGSVTEAAGGRLALRALRGNSWLGHPAHPIVVTIPIGAWVVSSWYDLKSARSGQAHDATIADATLAVGIVGAVFAAATGIAQFVGTRGQTRRETAVHAALNNAALTLNIVSFGLRRRDNRRLARVLSAAALATVGASGYLGGDLTYRHRVGVTTVS